MRSQDIQQSWNDSKDVIQTILAEASIDDEKISPDLEKLWRNVNRDFQSDDDWTNFPNDEDVYELINQVIRLYNGSKNPKTKPLLTSVKIVLGMFYRLIA